MSIVKLKLWNLKESQDPKLDAMYHSWFTFPSFSFSNYCSLSLSLSFLFLQLVFLNVFPSKLLGASNFQSLSLFSSKFQSVIVNTNPVICVFSPQLFWSSMVTFSLKYFIFFLFNKPNTFKILPNGFDVLKWYFVFKTYCMCVTYWLKKFRMYEGTWNDGMQMTWFESHWKKANLSPKKG